MRFGFIHRVMTDALAGFGVLALVLSGQFSVWVSVIILVALAGALILPESWQKVMSQRHLDTAALFGVLAIAIVRAVMNVAVLDVLVEFAAALQVIRLATRKGAAHDQQVIVLALLHLIAATVLGGGIGYGICFLGVVIVTPGALVLSHLRREVEGNYRQGARDRTGLPVDVPRILRSRRVVGRSFLVVTCLLSVPIFVFTVLLFVFFPRVGLSLLLMNRGHAGRFIGFSGRVDLGDVGVLRSDPTLAMRVEVPDLPEPPPPRLTLHLRGTALDLYDGRAWSQSEATQRHPAESDAGLIALDRYPDAQVEKTMRIDLEPIDPPVLFLPPTASGLRFRVRGGLGSEPMSTAVRGAEGELRYQPPDDRGIKYEVFLSRTRTPSFRLLPTSDRARYLALPADTPARIRTLSESWTRGATSAFDKARLIEMHLRTEYRYDLGSPSGRARLPLDDFLFETKRGHCEFYSTAMAVLLRVVNVPSRNVMGFIGGAYNRFGRFYTVRQQDAHSWVEAYIDEVGWVTFDPTPPGDAAPKSELQGFWANLRDFLEATSQRWERHVVGYDLNQQVNLLQMLTRSRTGSLLRNGVRAPRIRLALLPLLLVPIAAYVVARQRGRFRRRPDAQRPAKGSSSLLAAELYERLDAAMGVSGISRGKSVPPLGHALGLVAMNHPLGAQVLELTGIYLDIRFGGVPITDDLRRDFEEGIRALRAAAQGLLEEKKAARLVALAPAKGD